MDYMYTDMLDELEEYAIQQYRLLAHSYASFLDMLDMDVDMDDVDMDEVNYSKGDEQ